MGALMNLNVIRANVWRVIQPRTGVGKLFDSRATIASKIGQRGRARSIWTRNVIY